MLGGVSDFMAVGLSWTEGPGGSRNSFSFLYTGPGCDSYCCPGLSDGTGSLGSNTCR